MYLCILDELWQQFMIVSVTSVFIFHKSSVTNVETKLLSDFILLPTADDLKGVAGE